MSAVLIVAGAVAATVVILVVAVWAIGRTREREEMQQTNPPTLGGDGAHVRRPGRSWRT